MKEVFGFILAGVMAVFILNGCNSETAKIGVVDLTRVISESQEGKKANNELDALVKEKRADTTRMAEEIDKLRKNLDKEPAAARKNKEEELIRISGEYQKKVAEYESEVRTKAGELKAGLLKEIKNILDTIGSEDKYVLVLTAENAPYFQKTIDVTDKVIIRYNELHGTK